MYTRSITAYLLCPQYWGEVWATILWLTVAATLNISTPLYAQKNNFKFGHISIEQGLSQSRVLCIEQDQQGFMWFGTLDGLNKYDGYRFTIYKHDPENVKSLSHNVVRTLYQDRMGVLWIGTEGGLNAFDQETETFTHYRHDPSNSQSLGSNRVFSIHEDPSGILWIGTLGGGLNRFDRETKTFIRYQNDPADVKSLSDNSVWTIYEDQAGVFWIGTDGGLNKFDPRSSRGNTEQFIRYQHNPANPQSLSHNIVFVIYEDQSGTLWIGTDGGGLNRFNRDTETFTHYQNDPADSQSVSSNRVRQIYEDREGVFWVGTLGGGLNIFDRETEQFTHYQPNPHDPDSLSDNYVFSLYEDRSGILWIGTGIGGINTYTRQNQQFAHYYHKPYDPQSLSSNIVYSIYEDRTGALWIGTEGGGLNRFDRKTARFIHYPNNPTDPQSLSHNEVMAIYEDRSGVVWIGTDGGGLNRFAPQSSQGEKEHFIHYRHDPTNPQSLSNDVIHSLYEDQQGRFWIGTGDGLNRFDRGTGHFIHYQHEPSNPQSLSSNIIWPIYEDSSDGFWIGTFGGGLNRFDRETEQFAHYQHDPSDPQSLSNNIVLTIHEDQSGTLWIGTAGGLNKFDRSKKTFSSYTEKDGLPSDVISGILEDNRGNLWISTFKGLSRFNHRAGTFDNYDVSDGLQSNEFHVGAYHKSQHGEMFFGGRNGFNAFYPQDIIENPHIPPIAITDFQLFNRSVPIGTWTNGRSILKTSITTTERIGLSYKDSVFSFEFATLDYTAPEKNQYAYMLEGFDKEWVYPVTRRFVTYTNLDPGKYVFRVKGSNNDGVWNEEGTSINVTIIPPWWETWWFRIFALVGFIGIIFVAYQRRIQRTKFREKLLENQVAKKTQTLQREIAEHQQAEKALTISETNLKRSQQIARLGSWEADMISEKTFWSDEMINIFGIDPKTFDYQTDIIFEKMVHPDDKEKFRKAIETLLTGEKSSSVEYRIVLPNGETRHISALGEAMADETGRIVKMVGTAQDITKSKRVEEALRESEERYRNLVNTINDLAYTVDIEGKILIVNSLAKDFAGYEPEETIGHNFAEYVHPDDIPTLFAGIQQMLNGEPPENIQGIGQDAEYRVVRRDGEVIWVAARSRPIRDSQGQIIGFSGIARNITARKQTEEALRESQRFNQRVTEATPDIIYIYDMFEGRIVYTNRHIADVLGYTPEEIHAMGNTFLEKLLHSGDRVHVSKLLQRWDTATDEDILESEYRLKASNGKWHWFHSRDTVFQRTPDGSVKQLIGTTEDITERKQAEKALKRAKEEAEKANQAKSNFLARTSHELRTPLTAILGYTQILKRDTHLTEKQHEEIETIHRSGEYLLMMINEILDLSKIEAGKIEPEITTFSLSGFLKNIVNIIQVQAYRKGVSFTSDIAPDIPEAIYTDEQCLRQILLNLLSNAIKFTDRGNVTLKVWRHHFSNLPTSAPSQEEITHPSPSQEGTSAEALTTSLRFQVEDTGPGIPPEEFDDIFQPFEQVGDRRIQSQGIGLGLAISQRLVRMMGSELHLKSTLGQGSTFWFDLNIPTPDPGSLISSKIEPVEEIEVEGIKENLKSGRERLDHIVGLKGEKRKILIADDNKDNRFVLRDILSALGFEIIEAVDGSDALEKAKEYQPDLILMDLMMPVMDGFKATRQIRQQREFDDIIVMGISASASDQTREKSLKAGCNEFLAKPIDVEILLECLQTYLKLKWVYEDEVDKTQHNFPSDVQRLEPVIPLPQEKLTVLYNLARSGDISELHKQIPKIETLDPQFAAFVKRLNQLAKAFQINEIKKILKTYMQEEE